MSDVNATSKLEMAELLCSSQMCDDLKLGQHLEKLKKAEEGGDTCGESQMIASDILNEILETAMDLATKDPEDEHKAINPAEFREIIDGLGNNMFKKADNIENIEGDMKQFVGSLLNPDTKNIGIGDQPELNSEGKEEMCPRENYIEKKSRVTDLVMNSKKALNNILSEEQRKIQDEWEERNEHTIKVIELQKRNPNNQYIEPNDIPLPSEDDDNDFLGNPIDDTMDNVDLNNFGNKMGEGDECTKNIEQSCTQKKKHNWINKLQKFFHVKRNKNKGPTAATSDQGPN